MVDRSRQRSAGATTRGQARCEAIWRAVAAIPRGSVSTYGAIAATAGYPRAARLVGPALKAAPAALKLPWHRVVAAGGRIAFPQGSRPHREQQRRLESEGLAVRNGRVALPRVKDLDALLWGSDG